MAIDPMLLQQMLAGFHPGNPNVPAFGPSPFSGQNLFMGVQPPIGPPSVINGMPGIFDSMMGPTRNAFANGIVPDPQAPNPFEMFNALAASGVASPTAAPPLPPPQTNDPRLVGTSIPSSVAPTGKSGEAIRGGGRASASSRYTGRVGGVNAPTPLGPDFAKNLYAGVPGQINDAYAPLMAQIGNSFNLTPDQLPYIPPDPMADGGAQGASMALGELGAILKHTPEQGGDNAKSLEAGIIRRQGQLDKTTDVKRQASQLKDNALIGAEQSKAGDLTSVIKDQTRLAAEAAFADNAMLLKMWSDTGQWENSLKIANIAAAARSGDQKAQEQMNKLGLAQLQMTNAGIEVARQIAAGVPPEKITYEAYSPGRPESIVTDSNNKSHAVPKNYQFIEGLPALEATMGAAISGLQKPDGTPDYESQQILFTSMSDWRHKIEESKRLGTGPQGAKDPRAIAEQGRKNRETAKAFPKTVKAAVGNTVQATGEYLKTR
jgi:hypothetical protein